MTPVPKLKGRFTRFAKGDVDILKSFRVNPRQSVPQIHEALRLQGINRGKSCQVVWCRCRALRRLGYLQRTFRGKDGEGYALNVGHAIQYPTRKGWKEIESYGLLESAVGMGDRISSFSVEHEKKLTDVWLALRRAADTNFILGQWERLKPFLYRRGNGSSINPDVYLELNSPDADAMGYIELENCRESVDKRTGKPSIFAKVDNYEAYFEDTGEIGRVFFIFDSEQRARNFRERLLAYGYKKPRVFITWLDAVLTNPTGTIFMSPKCAEPTYTFFG